MKTLEIGKNSTGHKFSLPSDLVTQTLAVLAKRGVGKTYTASVIAEELLIEGQQVIIIDPTGAWWGIASGATPVVVIGGDNPATSFPIRPESGELLAKTIVEKKFSCVVDLSLLRKAESRRFLVPFFETLYRINREAVHLIIDEADDIAPQKPYADEALVLGAVEDIVKRGRKKGIGCTLITQRPADLAKQVLTQCEMLVTLRMTHPRDINAIKEWVNVHADPKEADLMIDSLPSLPIGTAWFWAPGWGDVFDKVQVRKRRTFDSSATPKPGEVKKTPKITKLDIDALGKEMEAFAAEVKENDPKALKAKVKQLEHNIEKLKQEAQVRWEKPQGISQVQVNTAFTKIMSFIQAEFILLSDKLPIQKVSIPEGRGMKEVTVEKPKASFEHEKHVETHLKAAESALSSSLNRILISVIQYPQSTKRQIALRTGFSHSSGTFNTYLSTLTSRHYIEKRHDGYTATLLGNEEVVNHYEKLPEGKELYNYWYNKVNRGQKKILDVLKSLYPSSVHKNNIAAGADMSETSGTFNTYLSELRTLGLIEGTRELKLADDLT